MSIRAGTASKTTKIAPAKKGSMKEPSNNNLSLTSTTGTATTTMDAKKKRKARQHWDIYVAKIRNQELQHLKKENPHLAHINNMILRKTALRTFESMINDLFRKFGNTLGELLQRPRIPSAKKGRAKLTVEDIKSACHLILVSDGNTTLVKIAFKEGERAVEQHNVNRAKYQQEHPSTKKSETATATGEKKKRGPNKTELAGTNFPVSRVYDRLKLMRLASSYSVAARIFLTGVLDAVFSVVFQQLLLVCIASKGNKTSGGIQIRQEHIMRTLEEDLLLKHVFPGIVRSGGVQGMIHPDLLDENRRKRIHAFIEEQEKSIKESNKKMRMMQPSTKGEGMFQSSLIGAVGRGSQKAGSRKATTPKKKTKPKVAIATPLAVTTEEQPAVSPTEPSPST